MKIKPFRAYLAHFQRISSSESFCEEAKNDFRQYLEQGLYDKTTDDAFFVYQIESPTGKHTGLVAANHLDDYFDHRIKKHEHTLSEKEISQARLFVEWGALLKPVLLTYPEVPAIEHWLQELIAEEPPVTEAYFPADQQTHRIWMVQDTGRIRYVQDLFAQWVPATYIADGHHRTSTLARLYAQEQAQYPHLDFSLLPCAYFSTSQLDILDYNRVVELPAEMPAADLLHLLQPLFDITALEMPAKPREKHHFVLFYANVWYELRLRPDVLARYPAQEVLLDATLLNELVLRDLLGITDARTDTRIRYVEGSKGWEGVQKLAEGNRAGFLLFPVDFDDLIHLADEGKSLPPKSTYFEPRMKTGIFVKMLAR
jgi:uncharacterized protein (DUF1015 family)